MTERVLPYDHGIVGQERGWDCGPASAQNVLSSRMHVSEADLIRSIGTTTNGTDHVGLIERDLDRRVPDAKYTTVFLAQDPISALEKEVLWTHLRSSIDSGWGVVMNWVSPPGNKPRGVKGSPNPRYSGGTTYHYVAAMGYDDNPTARAVWIADSGFSPFGYWVGFDQCATLIPPKGYCYATVDVKATPPPVAPSQPPAQLAITPTLAAIPDPRTMLDINKNSYRPRGMAYPLWIGVHTSESTSRVGALNAYCKSHQVSYNRLVDDRDILVAVEDGDAPWAAVGANKYALHVCFSASFSGWSREQWLDDQTANDGIDERAMLKLGAKQVAYWCRAHPGREIPAVWIGGGARPPWGVNGICGHVDFGSWGGGHTDPGVNFPVATFMGDVNTWLTGAPPVVIAPAPPVALPGTDPQKYAGWLLYQGNPNNDPDRVAVVQKTLKAGLVVDGTFGVLTKAAVIQFQKNKGLVGDGIVGPNTASALLG